MGKVNEEWKKALNLLEKSQSALFVTGKAGVGKTRLLREWKLKTKKSLVVLAPTGVAALEAGGQTIHSFFRFKPNMTKASIRKFSDSDVEGLVYRKLEAIVIDEVSMLRADLLDCIDQFLRLNGPVPGIAFGGVQMVFVGDLHQLPPVVGQAEREIFKTLYETPFFFSAHVLGGESPQQGLFNKQFEPAPFEVIELTRVYRQKDKNFLEILNAVRNNDCNEDHLNTLNTRYKSSWRQSENVPRGWIAITTTNARAGAINTSALNKLPGEEHVYKAGMLGNVSLDSVPAETELRIKTGSQVMLLTNDPMDRWVNGTIAFVEGFEKGEDRIERVRVLLPDGSSVFIGPHTWETFSWSYDKNTHAMTSEVMGTVTQYPLKLAWAITIHKSQGKTFDRVLIDIDRGTFAPGQLYVALSRCRTLEGIRLLRPIERQHVETDLRIKRFLKDKGNSLLKTKKKRIIKAKISKK